ncbi:ribonuclease P protein component [Gracilimonas mengyeensis]|uniref:Ribonuclease P protein component n=1 Tax=Gracilimonas mengyeensis TaxID=1302730 RepID=A0A521CG54_9BACT|nr:ribonuclease P protein component [Gracilimonas mengyeensis]SMO58382.1 ribonuclease P protein component [Gracilimonas mengyeensis]
MRRKEQRSNLSITDSTERRFNLPKSHRLSGKKNFEELFNSSSFFATSKITLRFVIHSEASRKFLAGFIAPKRIGNAVERVRVKRLLREAYRLNQHLITDLSPSCTFAVHYAFVARHSDIDFKAAQKDVSYLLRKLREHVISKTSAQ